MARATRVLYMMAIAALLCGAGYYENFDPSDYAVVSIETVDGTPFAAVIRNRINGRSYEFYPGDTLGPTKLVEITENNVVLEETLTSRVVRVSRSKRKMSVLWLASPATRFDAADWNTT